MITLDIIVSGFNFFRMNYYQYRARLLSKRLEEVPRYSYDYRITEGKLKRCLSKYYSLKDGTTR
jgi:hypothetical protein